MADRSVKVNIRGDISDYNRALLSGVAATKAFTASLDTSTDRAANLTQGLLAVGPALVPLGAAAIPAISGLTNQLAFAAAGAGVTALAFSGVGDALKATNDYAVEPTEANLAKMKETLNELGPAGQEFVGFLQEIRPELQGLQDAAQAGLFPRAQAGIEDLMTRLPQVERIVTQIAEGIGGLIAEAGDNLADPRWDDFFTFLENEAKPTLEDLGRTLGNFAEGFANLWMAFDPVSDQFSDSFLRMSQDFAAWTDGLSATEGFQEFIDYIQRVGPKAWDTLGALGNALLQIVEAAAPVGEVALPVIEAIADALAAVANSDVGPVLIGAAAGISAISRAVALYNVANGTALGSLLGRSAFGGAARAAKDLPAASRAYLDFGAALDATGPKAGKFATTSERLGASLRGAGKIAGGAAGLAFVMSDLDDKLGLANTAMGALAGTAFGPWGTAIGAGVGLVIDLASQTDTAAESVKAFTEAFGQTQSLEEQAQVIAAVKDQMALLRDLQSKAPDFAKDDFGDQLKTVSEGLAPLEAQYAANRRAAQELAFEEAGLSGAMDGADESTRNYTESLLNNAEAKNQAKNEALTQAEAELAYAEAIASANEASKENGENFDKGTKKGRDNRDALYDLAAAWNNQSDASKNAAGASEEARENFIRVAEAMTGSREKAERLADKYLEIPTNVTTKISTPGLASAAANVGSLLGQLRALDGTTASALVNISLTGADLGAALGKINQIKNSANGNLFDFYADGGMRENHVAQIAPANTIRVWAEPETGGEAYIPLATSKRARSLDIWAETGRRLGANLQRFADGGMASQVVSLQGASVDNRALARAVSRATRNELGSLFGQGIRIVGSGTNQRLELAGA